MNAFKNNNSLALLASRLKRDERLEFIYDQDKALRVIQKVKVTLFEEPMDGQAETDIVPTGAGRVYYRGSSWKARSDSSSPIIKGQKVLVTGRQELTLLVIPSA
ncbi:MAG TPA: NfeD family protein [Phormidium sp.]